MKKLSLLSACISGISAFRCAGAIYFLESTGARVCNAFSLLAAASIRILSAYAHDDNASGRSRILFLPWSLFQDCSRSMDGLACNGFYGNSKQTCNLNEGYSPSPEQVADAQGSHRAECYRDGRGAYRFPLEAAARPEAHKQFDAEGNFCVEGQDSLLQTFRSRFRFSFLSKANMILSFVPSTRTYLRLAAVFLAFLILPFCSLAQTTTSVTGQIKDLSGANVTSGQIAFTLQPGIDTIQSGIARFTNQEVDCTITGTGAIKALDGTSTCTVTNNTSLQPAGTSWKVCIQAQFVTPGSCFYWYATGGSIDLTQQIPTPPLTPAYNLVDTFSDQTIAGDKTFTGNLNFTGALSPASVNNLFSADRYANVAAAVTAAGTAGSLWINCGATGSLTNTNNIPILWECPTTVGSHSALGSSAIRGTYSIRDFGGDITGVTSSDTPFTNMLSAMPTGGGGVWVGNDHDYHTTSGFSFGNRSLLMRGAGRMSVLDGSGVSIATLNSSTFQQGIMDMRVTDTVGNASTIGVNIADGTNPDSLFVIQNSEIDDSGTANLGTGLKLTFALKGAILNNLIQNWLTCMSINANGASKSNSNFIAGNNIRACTTGINVASGAVDDLTLMNNIVEGNSAAGLSAAGGGGVIGSFGSHWENTGVGATNVKLDGTTSFASFGSNYQAPANLNWDILGTNSAKHVSFGDNFTNVAIVHGGSGVVTVYSPFNWAAPSGAGKVMLVDWPTLQLYNGGTLLPILNVNSTNSVCFFNDTCISRAGGGIMAVGASATWGDSTGTIQAKSYQTNTNCTSTGGTCGSAAAGAVTIAAAATTVTVSTTNVTANSEIFIQEIPAMSTRLSVTCNTTTGRLYTVTAITAGTSFVITSSAAPTTNPACLSFHIIN